MEIQEVEVTIDKKGQVKIHVRGVKGKACLDLTRDLEAALGSSVVSREATPEMQADGNANRIDQELKNKA